MTSTTRCEHSRVVAGVACILLLTPVVIVAADCDSQTPQDGRWNTLIQRATLGTASSLEMAEFASAARDPSRRDIVLSVLAKAHQHRPQDVLTSGAYYVALWDSARFTDAEEITESLGRALVDTAPDPEGAALARAIACKLRVDARGAELYENGPSSPFAGEQEVRLRECIEIADHVPRGRAVPKSLEVLGLFAPLHIALTSRILYAEQLERERKWSLMRQVWEDIVERCPMYHQSEMCLRLNEDLKEKLDSEPVSEEVLGGTPNVP